MLCNPLSLYPDKIDPFIFFQDVSLEKVEIMETYNTLIGKGKYSEASKYINSQSGICGYFADFLNAIENRIYNLQEYLLTIEPKRPFVYSDVDPSYGTHDILSDYSNDALSEYTHEEISALTNNYNQISSKQIFWI